MDKQDLLKYGLKNKKNHFLNKLVGIKWKKIIIGLIIGYILISPGLLIDSYNKGYSEGFWDGIYHGAKAVEDESKLFSPQQHLRIGDQIKSTDEYYHYSGTMHFEGYVKKIYPDGDVTIWVRYGVCKCDLGNYTINEYWLEKTSFKDGSYVI